MRSMFNGSIGFGLVNVGIKLYSAVEDTDLQAHQVHSHDGGRISYRKVCSTCEAAVPSHDISKQFEIDGHTAVLTEDDLSTLPSDTDKVIQVLEFVPAGSIDPLCFDKPFFVGPQNQGAMKAYALLAKTLEDSGRVAIARFTLRNRTRLAALGVTGKGILVLHALRWPDEVRAPVLPAMDTAVLDGRRDELTEAELKMASQLVDNMTTEFNPDRYQDTAKVELRELVMSKLGEPEAEIGDLLAKLKQSAQAKAVPKKRGRPRKIEQVAV